MQTGSEHWERGGAPKGSAEDCRASLRRREDRFSRTNHSCLARGGTIYSGRLIGGRETGQEEEVDRTRVQSVRRQGSDSWQVTLQKAGSVASFHSHLPLSAAAASLLLSWVKALRLRGKSFTKREPTLAPELLTPLRWGWRSGLASCAKGKSQKTMTDRL